MLVHVNLDSQVRRIAGKSRISIDVAETATWEQVIERIAIDGNQSLRNALLDNGGSARQSILVFHDDELVTRDQPLVLRDGSELTLTTLISGG